MRVSTLLPPLLLLSTLALACSGGGETPDPCDGPTRCVADGELPLAKLSDYDFFQGSMKDLVPKDGVVPYTVASPLWADQAGKGRYFVLPEGEAITFDARDGWSFPDGSIVVKTFFFDHDRRDPGAGSRIIETRLLIREAGAWVPVTYVWNDDETEAELLKVGKRIDVEFIDAAGETQVEEYIVPNLDQCASCHEDPATGTGRYSGNEDFAHADLLNLPAAVHGWHANYLRGAGAEACAYCHPANPQGATQCLRGGHSVNLDCTNCHGRIEDHALGLLKAEQEKGKPGAARLMANLVSPAVASHDEVVGRVPWLQEPDCLACHEDFTRPDPATASAVYKWVEGPSGLYRFSSDESGLIPCLSCHGSPHATFPTHSHKYGADRDNILPLQVQGNRRPIGAGGNCKVCHTIDMEDSIHHENMENP